jgi:DNA topoisomerase-1
MPRAGVRNRTSPIAFRLRSSDDSTPGIRRMRSGGGFRYRHDSGRAVSSADRERIRSLAIPPAYTDVWICADHRGHIQATGRDARGRKQYRYHPAWRVKRDQGKFERMVEFGRALPSLRRRVRIDLAQAGTPRSKVLAAIVRILGRSLERIGNESYRRDNRSYGLTTLQDRHAESGKHGLVLRFRGKGGAPRTVAIDDPRVARLIGRCRSLPGQHLFAYREASGATRRVDSGMVNQYLASALGQGFTAKDMRTWGATQAAISMLAPIDPIACETERSRAAFEREVVLGVAGLLGNTATVCRASYIDPAAFVAWRAGKLYALYQKRHPRGALQWERFSLQALSAARRV